jgi:hypothetical protein
LRVYHPNDGRHTLYVAPAADPRAVRAGVSGDWYGTDGRPKMFEVNFGPSGADVPDDLGRYLIATGQAKSTSLWLPCGKVL